MGDKGRQGETKQSDPSPACRHAMGDKGKRRETKQNHLSPASRHAMGDKERQRETKQNHLSPASGDKSNHLSPASKHAMGDKERQSKVISAQHPDTPWETRGKEGRQSKIISAQRPDMPWETKHTRGNEGKQSKYYLSAASKHAMGDKERKMDTKWYTSTCFYRVMSHFLRYERSRMQDLVLPISPNHPRQSTKPILLYKMLHHRRPQTVYGFQNRNTLQLELATSRAGRQRIARQRRPQQSRAGRQM